MVLKSNPALASTHRLQTSSQVTRIWPGKSELIDQIFDIRSLS